MKLERILQTWAETSEDFIAICDAEARVTWSASSAERAPPLAPGGSLFSLVAQEEHEPLRCLLARGRHEPDEIPALTLRAQSGTLRCRLRARPDGDGGVFLLGSRLPEPTSSPRRPAEQSELCALERRLAGRERQIEAQRKELERAYLELDESNKGMIALNTELADKAASLRRASDVKGRVVANVSHEFRTPLHTILGLSKLLLDGADGPLNDEQRTQVRFIRTSAEQLSVLVSDLLDLSKVEAGKVTIRPERFAASEMVAALRGMLRPLVSASNEVALVFDEPPADLALETDHAKVSQIVRNLVSNALKFTERGEVRVSLARDSEQMLVRVSDTGIGIEPGHFDAIFEEFGQVPNRLQEKAKGTGLGLPLSRRLAELLGGTLTVDSRVDQGSTFTLAIPIVHAEAREFASIQRRPLDPAKAPVMVVEDDRKAIFIYEKYLAMAGYQVVPARTIEDARKVQKAGLGGPAQGPGAETG